MGKGEIGSNAVGALKCFITLSVEGAFSIIVRVRYFDIAAGKGVW